MGVGGCGGVVGMGGCPYWACFVIYLPLIFLRQDFLVKPTAGLHS